MVFYNPLIRYVFLNSLKLNMSGIMAIRAFTSGNDEEISNFVIGIGTLAVISIIPVIFYCIIRSKRSNLNEP